MLHLQRKAEIQALTSDLAGDSVAEFRSVDRLVKLLEKGMAASE
jgi:hypothetical protein